MRVQPAPMKYAQATADTSKNDFWQRLSHFPLTGGLEPLYVVDSVIVAPERTKEINVHAIESITVLKSVEDLKAYGEKGRNGVILITMKADSRAPKKE